MITKNHKTILNIILCFGLAVYLFFVFDYKLPTAAISLVLFLYFWIIGRIYFGSFKLNSLLSLISGSGMLFSITYFFLYGVEEVPFPEGAILFHSQEIAISFVIFFISTVFILYVKEIQNTQQAPDDKVQATPVLLQKPNKSSTKENWEEATLDDLNSGNFELL